MAVSPGLRRLLRIRELEEEQSSQALESAMGELWQLEAAIAASEQRKHRGRELVRLSAHSGELPDRLSGIEESHAAGRAAAVLAPRIAEAKAGVAALREEFLNKRVERRQAETLIEEAEAKDAVEGARRSQQALDDWYRIRRHREGAKTARASRETDAQASNGVLSHQSDETRKP
jgi:flagellar biosynthesis chaperone FliJ